MNRAASVVNGVLLYAARCTKRAAERTLDPAYRADRLRLYEIQRADCIRLFGVDPEDPCNAYSSP